MRGTAALTGGREAPAFLPLRFMRGSLPGARRVVAGQCYVPVFDRQRQVRQAGQRRGPLPVGHDVRLSRRIATGGAFGAAEEIPWAGSRIEAGQGHRALAAGEKELWPSASGGLEMRKERSCGRSRSVQDDADRLRRLAGDNVRPLMRPAHRQGGSMQKGA